MTVELNSNLTFSLTRLDDGPPWYDSAQPDGGSSGGSGSWTEGQEPSISSVSGDFTAGQQATISVSNLSAKRSGQLKFINFEDESVGTKTTEIAQSDDPPDYVIDDESPLFGSKYAQCFADQESLGQAAVLLDTQYDEIFFEGWGWIDKIDFTDPESAQIKLWRLVPENSIGATVQSPNPGVLMFDTESQGFYIGASPDVMEGAWYAGSSLDSATWYRYSCYFKFGTEDTEDGKRYVKVGPKNEFTYSSFPDGHFASPSGDISPDEWDGDLLVTNDGDYEEPGIGSVWLPYYTRDEQTTDSRVDRIFVNDSPERVVVGDDPDFKQCDPNKTFILPQVSRDSENEEIVVDIDALGPLDTGPVYLFVFNQDGLYNSTGYEWRAS